MKIKRPPWPWQSLKNYSLEKSNDNSSRRKSCADMCLVTGLLELTCNPLGGCDHDAEGHDDHASAPVVEPANIRGINSAHKSQILLMYKKKEVR